MTLEEATAEAFKVYPIYTLKNPNPFTKKPDCPIDLRRKEYQRTILISRLLNGKTGIS